MSRADPRMNLPRRYGRLVDHVPGVDEEPKRKAARRGEIPGAFQLRPGGMWFLDLEVWEAHLERLMAHGRREDA